MRKEDAYKRKKSKKKETGMDEARKGRGMEEVQMEM